jgi:hypothetical protein
MFDYFDATDFEIKLTEQQSITNSSTPNITSSDQLETSLNSENTQNTNATNEEEKVMGD